MTVSFKTRAIDSWYYLSYLATRTVTGLCLLVFVLVALVAGPATAWYNTVPGSKAEHFMAEAFVPTVLGIFIILSFCTFLGLLLGTLITPLTTMTIDPQFCHRKDWFKSKTRWQAFLTLSEEADYYYLMGWHRAFYIPKRAFDSRAEADRFFQTALTYWRSAKDLPPPPAPDTSGVWPPAPRPGNSAEPGDAPSC